MPRRKRQLQRGSVEPRRSKRLKAANRGPMLLTDVVDDCLEHVFMHLSLDDLLNIAHTNKQLKPAADKAFRRKFGKEKFTLNQKLKEKKQTFKLLRCFGHLITNLDIFDFFKMNAAKVNEYINKHCSESLLEICIRDMSRDKFKELKKPFVNVEIIHFWNWRLEKDCNPYWIIEQFPKIKKLKIFFQNSGRHLKCLETQFQHLQDLDINYSMVSSYSIITCIRSNPQLRSLTLDRVTNLNEVLKVASQNLKQLEHLNFAVSPDDLSYLNDVLHFDSLKNLKLTLFGGSLSKLQISADQLNELKLAIFCFDDGELIDFLEAHKTITKLALDIDGIKEPSQTLPKIAISLRLLKEVSFSFMVCIDSSDAVQFVRTCESLEIFRFRLRARSQFDGLKQHLSHEWETTWRDEPSWWNRVEIKRK